MFMISCKLIGVIWTLSHSIQFKIKENVLSFFLHPWLKIENLVLWLLGTDGTKLATFVASIDSSREFCPQS